MSQVGGVSLEALIARAERAGQSAPPGETWNPAHCGVIDLRIDARGDWYHEGSLIRRPELVRLFSTILRREPNGGYVLVTPVEKLTIDVEDVPYLAVEMNREEREGHVAMTFRTNVGDVVEVGPTHPLRFADGEEFRPYVLVRGRLEARVTRAVAMDMAEFIEERNGRWGIVSNGQFFELPTIDTDRNV